MAAPLVSGIVAHMKARYPHASPDQITEALRETAVHPIPYRRGIKTHDYGHGTIKPKAAIEALDEILRRDSAPPTTVTPPTTTLPAVPSSVTLTVGGSAQGWQACRSEHCKHLSISLDAPAGEYDVECWSSRDPEPWYAGTWSWPTSALWTEGGCWFGYPGEQVWAVVDGIKSNTVTWPADTPTTSTSPTTTTAPEDAPTGLDTHMDRRGIISAGQEVSCAIRTDQTVICWGRAQSDVLNVPPGTFTAVSVGVGAAIACGIRTDQTLVCWGTNGEGSTYAPSGTFTFVSVGFNTACAIRIDQTVTCWGGNYEGKADAPPGTFSAVSPGYVHSCGLRTDRTITCWGDNGDGRADAPEGTFTALSAGMDHSCAVRTDGTIVCWGYNRNGLTEGDFPAGTYTSVTSGDGHSCALEIDQTITCWQGSAISPVTKDTPAGQFLAVSARWSHSCGVRIDRTITCWGWNHGYGELDAPAGHFGPG